MTKSHEKLLIATLAGLVITAAAAFVIQPALTAGPSAGFKTADLTTQAHGDVLPASFLSDTLGRSA